jgi:hypothetical protein
VNISLCFAFLTSLALGGCSLLPAKHKAALCPNGQTLRIGVDQQLFTSQQAANQQEKEIKRLESFLQKTTHCLIQIEPIVNANIGRESLNKGIWDFTFLAPSLSVIALADNSQYVPLRSLGQDISARSALLVRNKDNIRSYSELNNKRIGLLLSDLNGYYLPRFNLHGVKVSYVDTGLSYDDLAEKLKKNIVIKDKSTIYPARHNKKWSKFEEQQLIDGIIMGKSHPEIGEIHQRTETSITSRLYAIAIRLIKENKTNISDIVTIFDLNRDILSSLINKSLSKLNK